MSYSSAAHQVFCLYDARQILIFPLQRMTSMPFSEKKRYPRVVSLYSRRLSPSRITLTAFLLLCIRLFRTYQISREYGACSALLTRCHFSFILHVFPLPLTVAIVSDLTLVCLSLPSLYNFLINSADSQANGEHPLYSGSAAI